MIVVFLSLFVLINAQLTTYSGFVQVNQQYDANLFYYFIESQNNPSTDPVILWLQGGPGCSSLFGCFVENGPSLINADGSFSDNAYSWTRNASVLYVDQPVGTGYSYVSDDEYVTDEATMGKELYILLYSFFFTLHPEYSKNDFWITGESYGGKYVPWITFTILTNNNNTSNKKINLVGIGIGDGYINPYIQDCSNAPYLYHNGLINSIELAEFEVMCDVVDALIDASLYDEAMYASNIMFNVLMAQAGLGDPYDIRKSSDPTEPLQDALTDYLNEPSVMKQFNATQSPGWQACNTDPYFALINDFARSSEILLPMILAQIPIYLYSGNYDLICNWEGTAELASSLQWPHQNDWNNAKNQTWVTAEGQTAGWYKISNGFAHIIVEGAGHMVPYDQPQSAFDLITRIIANDW